MGTDTKNTQNFTKMATRIANPVLKDFPDLSSSTGQPKPKQKGRETQKSQFPQDADSLTLLDQFANSAMMTLMSNGFYTAMVTKDGYEQARSEVAFEAYEIAYKMLKSRQRILSDNEITEKP